MDGNGGYLEREKVGESIERNGNRKFGRSTARIFAKWQTTDSKAAETETATERGYTAEGTVSGAQYTQCMRCDDVQIGWPRGIVVTVWFIPSLILSLTLCMVTVYTFCECLCLHIFDSRE